MSLERSLSRGHCTDGAEMGDRRSGETRTIALRELPFIEIEQAVYTLSVGRCGDGSALLTVHFLVCNNKTPRKQDNV